MTFFTVFDNLTLKNFLARTATPRSLPVKMKNLVPRQWRISGIIFQFASICISFRKTLKVQKRFSFSGTLNSDRVSREKFQKGEIEAWKICAKLEFLYFAYSFPWFWLMSSFVVVFFSRFSREVKESENGKTFPWVFLRKVLSTKNLNC